MYNLYSVNMSNHLSSGHDADDLQEVRVVNRDYILAASKALDLANKVFDEKDSVIVDVTHGTVDDSGSYKVLTHTRFTPLTLPTDLVDFCVAEEYVSC